MSAAPGPDDIGTAGRSPLSLLPAIDLQGGRCVRLVRGDFDAETVFGDPVAVARTYAEAGATALHIVDLDAARTGEPVNRPVVRAILEEVALPVQIGGGVRDERGAEELLALGVSRVVLGTAGVENPSLVQRLAAAHPDAVVVGLDHRRSPNAARSGREVALRGWREGSGMDLLDALESVAGARLAGVLMTDITVDGTLEGPDLAGYRLALAQSAQPIIASGGVGSAADIALLAALEEAGRRLVGVVVGKALLSGAVTMKEARDACAR